MSVPVDRETLCILGCRSPDHWPDCDRDCIGCLPYMRAPGLTVCDPCRRRLWGRLRGIPDLYVKLEVEIVAATPPPSSRSPRGQAPMPVSASNLDVLKLRISDPRPGGDTADGEGEQIDGLSSLEGWCRVVIEERDFSWPTPSDTVYGRLLTACGFLRTHLDWVLAQMWVDELAFEVGVLHRALRAAVEPEGRWVKTRIPCPTDPCAGVMWWDCLDPGSRVLTCRACGDTWQPEALWILAERTQTPVSLRDAADFLGETYGNMRHWVARGNVPNRGTDGTPRVLLAEVLAARRAMVRRA